MQRATNYQCVPFTSYFLRELEREYISKPRKILFLSIQLFSLFFNVFHFVLAIAHGIYVSEKNINIKFYISRFLCEWCN